MRGTDMLFAPSIIRFAQELYLSGSQGEAHKILASWPGIRNDHAILILERDPRVEITIKGDDAVVMIKKGGSK
jgi:hypothetical protein